jgi:DegV family protein with EDD domain
MSKVAVVTDSTAYIPKSLLQDLNVHILPLQLIWDGLTLEDGVDILPAEFYDRLKNAKTMPTTSQATPYAFHNLFTRLLDEGFDIFNLLISAKLSGTLDSAAQACQDLPAARIELFDSESTSMAMGFQVLAVARAAAHGATLKECALIARQARMKTDVYFAVNTLEFLRRGGRIGGTSAFIGSAFNIKPILKLQNGRIEAVEKIRTMSKAVDRISELIEQHIDGQRPIHLAALHANAAQEAQALLERIQQKFSPTDIADAFVTEVSPVVGTHAGPGTVGIALMTGM